MLLEMLLLCLYCSFDAERQLDTASEGTFQCLKGLEESRRGTLEKCMCDRTREMALK